MAEKPKHRFRFFRAGGVDQVDLDEPGAIEHLASLDPKLWVALACPTHGLELEARTLELVDTDHDGRIRPPEVLAAVAWLREVLTDLDGLSEGKAELLLSAISDKTERGRMLKDGARRILSNLGRPDATVIALADVEDTERIFRDAKVNGDGVVPPFAAEDEASKKTLEDIIATVGSVSDRSGQPGVDKAKADAFFAMVAPYAAWLREGDRPELSAIGAATPAAYRATQAVREKVDDYFVRAKLVAFDGELAPSLLPIADKAIDLSTTALAPTDARVAGWPLARASAGRPLPLTSGLNPAWAERMDAFVRDAVTPVLGGGKTELRETEWEAIKGKLAPFAAWQAARPDLAVGKLGDARVLELAKGTAEERVRQLIVEDAALAAESNQIEAVEKALRLRRDLLPLLRNFVSFADLYGKRKAVFQVGTLFLDARSCDLCLAVQDVAKHATLAALAKAYLVYCDCKRGTATRTIVAVVTAGDVDNIMVGRNGVFYDRKGDDWDATVTRVVEAPISVRQAFFTPYKRFLRLIEQQITKRAASADADVGKSLEDHATTVTAAEPEKAGQPKKIDVGTVAAIGVAIGGIATFFSSVLATFMGLGMWMPFGVVALVLAISGPSMLIAQLKLSQRNIGPILDANGWAVNAFARLNAPFGAALTQLSAIPSGSRRTLEDPFAEKKPPLRRYVALVVLLLAALTWWSGRIDGFLPVRGRAGTVLHRAH